jgi:hypothetical protein
MATLIKIAFMSFQTFMFIEDVVLDLVKKTKFFYVLLTLFECLLTTTPFEVQTS